jgi:hypothetical protein
LVGRRGGVRRAVTDWTGVHHQPRPGGRAVGSGLDRRGEHWPKFASRATERDHGPLHCPVPRGRRAYRDPNNAFCAFPPVGVHCRAGNLSRRWKRASMRLAAAPTRRSCTVHCKEQSQNNGIGPAIVSYSPRLVRRGAGGLRDFPPSLVSKSIVWFPLSGLERSATCAAARASARQKTRSSILRGPVGATLVSTLFSKILVTRVNRKISDASLRTWAQRRRGEGLAPPQRRHSMATNSSRAEVPLVVGTAPAISSRSILRNDAASA